MRRQLWRSVVAAMSIAMAGAPWMPARAGCEPAPPTAQERYDKLTRTPSLGQFWGAVLVAKGDDVFARGYGLVDERGEEIDRATLFDIGSVTKQFTAAGALKLQSQGKLTLDEPVATYLPGLEGKALERAKVVTLRHLLLHTSGMSDREAIQAINFPDRDKAVAIAIGSKPTGGPGAAFEYCNSGYIVAAAVIERVSGVQYEQYVVNEVMRPAGMRTAGFINGVGIDPKVKAAARVVEQQARGYTGKLVNDPREVLGWGLKGAGGIAASLDDMLAWARALTDAKVLDAAAQTEMFSPGLDNYALGWFVTMTPAGTEKWAHSGGTRGFVAQFFVYPRERSAIAVLTNSRHNPDAIAKALEAEIFETGSSGAIEATVMYGALMLDEYLGEKWSGGTVVRVTRTDDGAAPRMALEVVRAGERIAARVRMDPESARALAGQIRGVCGPAKASEPTLPGTFWIGGMVYRDQWPGGNPPAEYALSDVKWRVMPAYRGAGKDNKPVIDARPTLVLVDEQHGFWPMIVTINPGEARTLADELSGKQPE